MSQESVVVQPGMFRGADIAFHPGEIHTLEVPDDPLAQQAFRSAFGLEEEQQ